MVTFDTNVYRDLLMPDGHQASLDNLESLKRREANVGVVPLANPTVVIELLAALRAEEQKHFLNARNATALLAHHCAYSINGDERIASLTDPITQLCHEVFGERPVDQMEFVDVTVSTCRFIQENMPVTLDGELASIVDMVGRFSDRAEDTFIDHFRRTAAQAMDPDYQGWDPFSDAPRMKSKADAFFRSQEAKVAFARMQILNCASALGKDLADEEVARLAETFTNQLAVPANLFNEVARRIFAGGCNLTRNRRGNWHWDINIAMSIGPFSNVQGRPNHLVTSDRDILEAARVSECSDRVMRWQDYEGFLATL